MLIKRKKQMSLENEISSLREEIILLSVNMGKLNSAFRAFLEAKADMSEEEVAKTSVRTKDRLEETPVAEAAETSPDTGTQPEEVEPAKPAKPAKSKTKKDQLAFTEKEEEEAIRVILGADEPEPEPEPEPEEAKPAEPAKTAKPAKPAKPAKTVEQKGVVKRDIINALMALADQKGRDVPQELLDKHGYTTVSAIPESDYGSFMEEIESLKEAEAA
jgi:hypothetical protein